MSKSGFLWICNAKKSGQVPPERPNLSGCEIRICPDAIYKKKKINLKKQLWELLFQ